MLWAAALWCYSAMFTPCPTTMNISKGVTALPHIDNSPCFSSSPLSAPLFSHQTLFQFFTCYSFHLLSSPRWRKSVLSSLYSLVSYPLHLLYTQCFVYLPDSPCLSSHSLSLSHFFPVISSFFIGSWVGTHVQINRCETRGGENAQYAKDGQVSSLSVQWGEVKCNNH